MVIVNCSWSSMRRRFSQLWVMRQLRIQSASLESVTVNFELISEAAQLDFSFELEARRMSSTLVADMEKVDWEQRV